LADILESLKKRGLGGVQLITSDDHAGLRAARLAVFGGIPWQRCQFHLQQNAQAYVPHKDMQSEVAEDIRTIFNAPDRATANAYLAKTILKYEKTASRLSSWMVSNLPEGLMVFSFPEVFSDCCARPMAWKDSTGKSVAGLVSSVSFQTRRLV
jgi:putative transposase